MERLILVSGDSHASPPPEAWPEYIESRYHHLLPALLDDNRRFTESCKLFADFTPEDLAYIDSDGLIPPGLLGVWDPKVRLREMDREGVAAELVYPGDPRALPPFFTTTNRQHPQDVNEAGVRAYHRWAAETFGDTDRRIMFLGDSGPCLDISESVRQLTWIAEHHLVGVTAPGAVNHPSLPPLFDPYFEPFWSACEDLGLVISVHAGYGLRQGDFMKALDEMYAVMQEAGRSDFQAEMVHNTEKSFFALDNRPRRAMWQLMLGGVFDRHPRLKVMLTEIRADWLPETLRHLDRIYARGNAPAKRKPSEYWATNFIAGVSSIHKAEVDMRDEIGVEHMMFGRDYPHAEGTWPNTYDWLNHAFASDVSEADIRNILGENAIRFLGLDRTHLAGIASRTGPGLSEIDGSSALPVDERKVNHFHARAGYLRPREEVDVAVLDELVTADLDILTG
jgi:predicted TIM-barrel fold metal-dependent hydrolase